MFGKSKKKVHTPSSSASTTGTFDATPYTPTGGRPVEIDKTILNHEHEAGIQTKEAPKEVLPDVTGKYTFCFNGGSLDNMFKGIEVELDTSMNPTQCRDYLQGKLDGIINMKGKQLIVYLSGGLPFLSGKLGDVYQSKSPKFSNIIYGVITHSTPDVVLKSQYPELCNIQNPDRQKLISPLCDSSKRGLSDMACLLGYLNHDGAKGDLLLRTCAKVITFAPLITSMRRIIDRNQVVGRDVIAVSSTLFTFFRCLIPSTTKDEIVLEYTLRLCNLITHINQPPDSIPLYMTEVKRDESSTQFLSNIGNGPIAYIWQPDTGKEFTRFIFELTDPLAIQNAYNIIASFKPIAPLSTRIAPGCSIVRGKEHEYLYLMQSPSKDEKDQNKVDIIDPMTGLTDSLDVEAFAREQGDTQIDKTEDLIEPDHVKQIIMVNFDESGSMKSDLNGRSIKSGSEIESRTTIACQYLTTFANRTYGYRIPCIQGLISFNNDINLRCPLSPLVPDFEDKGLKQIRPKSVTRLWDSLDRACKEIVSFRKDSNGNERFKNAVSRVLVISDGEDVDSKSKVEDVTKELIENKIIVDSVIVSATESCKMLCAVCHATGGLCFRPENVSAGLFLFEQSAFLNYEERKAASECLIPGDRNTSARKLALNPSAITPELMEQGMKNASFNTKVDNSELLLANAKLQPLATPANICAKNVKAIIPDPRKRRILRELHATIPVCDPNSDYFDPDLKVLTYKTNLDRWKVYFKGPESTPYEGKWWYMMVNFPPQYPVQPPIFRFISIPYHLNISSEGRICMNVIEKGYISSKHVIDILQQIKEIFLYPDKDSPIQIEKLDIFLHNRPEYDRLAKKSSEDNAKDNYEDYIDSHIDSDIPDGFSSQFDEEHVPPYMVSQISGRKIKNPILSSTGVYYDKDELKQLVTSNKNPRCIITGNLLTEKPEDFDETDHI